MKRFWLFAGAVYYPGGGMSDFQGDFDSLDEAMDHFKTFPKGKFDTTSGMWVHVFDSVYGVVVGDLDQWNSESLIDGNKLKIRGVLPVFENKTMVEVATRDADEVSDLIQAGKRVPRGMTETLRNHVRKLATALAVPEVIEAPKQDRRTVYGHGDD